MKKAPAKGKAKNSKPAQKKHSRKPRKPLDLAEVRQNIAVIVTHAAPQLTEAVVEEGLKGQLAPVKYLFEMAGLFPAPDAQPSPEQDSFAKTLLDRLGLLSNEPGGNDGEAAASASGIASTGSVSEDADDVDDGERTHRDNNADIAIDAKNSDNHTPLRVQPIP